MAHERRRGCPAARPDAVGRPSPRAADRLVEQLVDELSVTRAAWDDALHRGDERLRARDPRGAVESLEDQRRLLRLLEDRLDKVVAAAAVEREAEAVLAHGERSATTVATAPPAAVPVAVTEAPPTRSARRGERGRLPALVGAGATLLLAAVALVAGAVLGGEVPTPEIAGPPDAGERDPTAPVDDDDAVSAAHESIAGFAPEAGVTGWLSPLGPLADDAAASDDERDQSGQQAPQEPAAEAAQRDEPPADRDEEPAAPDEDEAPRDGDDEQDEGADVDVPDEDLTTSLPDEVHEPLSGGQGPFPETLRP